MSAGHMHVRIHLGITGGDAPHEHPEFELGSSCLCGKCFYPQSHLNCAVFTSL